MLRGTDIPESVSGLWDLQQLKLLMKTNQQTEQSLNIPMRTTLRRRGEWIYMLGEPSTSIYFLQEGRVKLSALSENGHEVLLDIIGPAEIFGDVGALQGVSRTTSAQALDDSILCEMQSKDFQSLLANYPQFALNLMRSLGSRLRKAEEQLLSLICKNVSTRLREALLELIGEAPEPPVRIGITQQDLANMIGASRQKTSQALKELEDGGVLELKYRGILVTAPQKLRDDLMFQASREAAAGRFHH